MGYEMCLRRARRSPAVHWLEDLCHRHDRRHSINSRCHPLSRGSRCNAVPRGNTSQPPQSITGGHGVLWCHVTRVLALQQA